LRSKPFPPPFRHAPGSAARRKADEGGRRAATRRLTLVVMPERSGGKIKQMSCRAPSGGGQNGAAKRLNMGANYLTGFRRI